jgi:hypothetical protein
LLQLADVQHDAIAFLAAAEPRLHFACQLPAGDSLQPLTLAALVEAERALATLAALAPFLGAWQAALPGSPLAFRRAAAALLEGLARPSLQPGTSMCCPPQGTAEEAQAADSTGEEKPLTSQPGTATALAGHCSPPAGADGANLLAAGISAAEGWLRSCGAGSPSSGSSSRGGGGSGSGPGAPAGSPSRSLVVVLPSSPGLAGREQACTPQFASLYCCKLAEMGYRCEGGGAWWGCALPALNLCVLVGGC